MTQASCRRAHRTSGYRDGMAHWLLAAAHSAVIRWRCMKVYRHVTPATICFVLCSFYHHLTAAKHACCKGLNRPLQTCLLAWRRSTAFHAQCAHSLQIQASPLLPQPLTEAACSTATASPAHEDRVCCRSSSSTSSSMNMQLRHRRAFKAFQGRQLELGAHPLHRLAHAPMAQSAGVWPCRSRVINDSGLECSAAAATAPCPCSEREPM